MRFIGREGKMIKIICFSIILICNIAILISSIIRYRTLEKMYKEILEEEKNDFIVKERKNGREKNGSNNVC